MEYQYKAFISYNHNDRDTAVAKALHTMIETYTIPHKLRKNGTKKPGKVFRDEEELSASSDLSQHIRDALDASEFLIVICSPGAVESRWVSQEIAHFLKHHGPEKLLTVLTGGKPEDIFKKLLQDLPEPSYLDLTESSDASLHRDLKERFLKICATLLGHEYDKLFMRDQKRKRQQLLYISAAVMTIAAVIIGILLWSNHQIEGKNRELELQNDRILLRESELLTKDALEALENKDQVSAVRNALAALPSAEQDRPYYAPAESALFYALDILSMDDDVTMIPRDTRLNQSTPIMEFCISADGTLLTTLDEYRLLTCFHTATGEQLWTREMATNSIFEQLYSMEGKIHACEQWNSVIATYGDTIYSIDQDTGEILWTNDHDNFSNFFELSDDGQYLAYMFDEYNSNTISLACISTRDGTMLNVFPVAESVLPLALTETDACDLSADGKRFVGCYGEELSDESYVLVYFVTDLTTGRTETILRQEVPDIYKCIYSFSFDDRDSSLTVVRESDDTHIAAIVEKVSIPDRSLIWQTATPSELDDRVSFSYWDTYHLIDCGAFLLLGVKDRLYALNPEDGSLWGSEKLDSTLVSLEARNDGYYTLTLADGTLSFGWLSNSSLHYLFITPLSMELGAIQGIDLWNEGYLRIIKDEYGTAVLLDSVENGFGYAAIVPKEDDRTIIVRRLEEFHVDLDRRILLERAPGENMTYNGILTCGEDTLLLNCFTDISEGNGYTRYIFLDRTTLDVTDSVVIDIGRHSSSQIFRDGTGFFYFDNDDQFCSYDLATQSSTVLAPRYGSVQLNVNGTVIDTEHKQYHHIRSSADYSMWTILVTDRGLKLWIDGQAQQDVLYPKEIDQIDINRVLSTGVLLGSDGYILLDLLEQSDMVDLFYGSSEICVDSYFIYSVHDAKWYQIPFGEQDAVHRRTCMGEVSPTFTVMDSSGLIRSYDIPSGKQTMAVPTGLNTNTVSQFQWILEDRYLTVFTQDQQLLIIDGTTAETVYHTSLSDYYLSDPLSFAADPQGKRLYIWNSQGLCVSIEEWTALFEIRDIEMYSPDSDRILYMEQFYGDENTPDQLIAYRIPATEELVGLGKQFLGE